MSKLDFNSFPELLTDKFRLRQLRSEDEQEIFLLRSDERVMRYLDRLKAESIDDAREFINKINSAINNNECIYWAISQKHESRLIGTICFWNITDTPFTADLGFELLPDYQGKGIIQEVIPAVLDYGFKGLKFEKIIGEVSPGNIKSIKVLERFSFKLETKQRDILRYSLTDTSSPSE
jgi:[ribosomal protein S5]-alanine N-acetyltransferase